MTRQVLALAAVIFAVTLAGSVAVDARQSAPRRTSQASAPAGQKAPAKQPAPFGVLPPLPRVPFEPVRPMPVVQQVYDFAARHPEVLQYIPCYCGCERSGLGHKANDECFVKSRAANGRILEWEPHGMGCEVCLDVGRKAMTMFNQGMSVPEIRAAIEREYSSRYPSHTPTPLPPASGKPAAGKPRAAQS
jgi:hypothetical protein